jgi:hypothetical protein
MPCPVAYTSTARLTAEETTSIREENWSTTMTIPQGGSQPPMFTAAVPPSQTDARSRHSSARVRESSAMLTVRCARECLISRKVRAAPRMGSTTASGAKLAMFTSHLLRGLG